MSDHMPYRCASIQKKIQQTGICITAFIHPFAAGMRDHSGIHIWDIHRKYGNGHCFGSDISVELS